MFIEIWEDGQLVDEFHMPRADAPGWVRSFNRTCCNGWGNHKMRAVLGFI